MLTQERLKEVLHYDQDTGIFTWLISPRYGIHVGAPAGCVQNKGYIIIRIRGTNYGAHRLAFLYVTGQWPKREADHINMVTGDNRWINLREATKSENAQNQRSANIDSQTGFLGVSKSGNKFRAKINLYGVRRHLGSYETPELAHAAYLKAKRKLHPGCTI